MASNLFVPLAAARRAPPLAPVSPSSALLIRAPLSFDDSDSGSELDSLSTAAGADEEEGFATASGSDDDLPAPEPALSRSSSMPIAQLTNDDDDDDVVESEGFDDDGLFVGVARVPSLDGSPSFGLGGGEEKRVEDGVLGEKNPSSGGKSSGNGVLSEKTDLKESSSSSEGGVLSESPSLEENSAEGVHSSKNGVLEQNPSPEKNSSKDGVSIENADLVDSSTEDPNSSEVEVLLENLSSEGKSSKDGVLSENTDFLVDSTKDSSSSKDGVLSENTDFMVDSTKDSSSSKDGVLSEDTDLVEETTKDSSSSKDGVLSEDTDLVEDSTKGGASGESYNLEENASKEPSSLNDELLSENPDLEEGSSKYWGLGGSPILEESSSRDGVLSENTDLEEGSSKDPNSSKDEVLNGSSNLEENSSREVLGESCNLEKYSSKDVGLEENHKLDESSSKDEVLGESSYLEDDSSKNSYPSKDGVLCESPDLADNSLKEWVLSKSLNLEENSSKEPKFSEDEAGGDDRDLSTILSDNSPGRPTICEDVEVEMEKVVAGSVEEKNRFLNAQDEKDETLDDGSEGMSPIVEEQANSKVIEVTSNDVEVQKNGDAVNNSLNLTENTERTEDLKHIEVESEVDAKEVGPELVLSLPVDVSERGLDEDYVDVNSEIADSSAKLDNGNGVETNEGIDGSNIALDYEIAQRSPNKHDVASESEITDIMTSPNQAIGNEKMMIESEQHPTEMEVKTNEPDPELVVKSRDSISAHEEESPTTDVSETGKSDTEIVETPMVVEIGSHFGSDEETINEEQVEGQGLQGWPKADANEAEEKEDSDSEEFSKIAILESSEAAKQMIKDIDEGSSSSRDYSHNNAEGKELLESAALVSLLKVASDSSPNDNITRIFSADQPSGLGSSIPPIQAVPPLRSQPAHFSPSNLAVSDEPKNSMDEKDKNLHNKYELVRVKFLRLLLRLGHSPEDTVAAQVLYRLGVVEDMAHGGRPSVRSFSFESARKKAFELEMEGREELDFSCNILVLGKTGVGKSATINSIFGEYKSLTNPFEPETSTVREITGIVDGVRIRILDTPGLRTSVTDQALNKRILSSVRKYVKKCPPDIVLYVDRMDTKTPDSNDLLLLRMITGTLGSSIWFNAIIALTHASSAPPDGLNGSQLSYDVFIAQRSHVVQQSIRQAVRDMRVMNPAAPVENHPSCRRNREGQRVLPNGSRWRSQLLLLCYSSKILSETNSLLELGDASSRKLFGFRLRSPPMHFFLSSLLQLKAHPKLSSDQGGENGDLDIDLDDFSDRDDEEDEYDQLPPFKPLRKSQLAKLAKEQKRAYFDEYDYRVKLLHKKQWREDIRRFREIKKRGKSGHDQFGYSDVPDELDQDNAPAAVPVPLPDMMLPPSFDCDDPAYRYRFLEPSSRLLTRPVLDTHGWDHDCGYDGVNIEDSLGIAGRFPMDVSVQVTKDKKEFNIHLDSSVSAKHGESGSTLVALDVQTVGKQLAYLVRGETKFKNLEKNKTTAGVTMTFLGETVATGMKLADEVTIGKRVSLAAGTGAVRAQGDVAYGANLEVKLREKDYPIGQVLATLGLSMVRWHGDLALAANLQSQFLVGRNSTVTVRVGLNNKSSGQIAVRTSSSEQIQVAVLGLIPIVISVFRSIRPGL